MTSFTRDEPARRIVFSAGSLERIGDEIDRLGLRRVLVVTGGSASDVGQRVADLLGPRGAHVFATVRQHVPETLAIQAIDAAKHAGADGLCSIGGGSATGLAKAVAVDLNVPIVAVPTTYAGSEMTPIYGITGTHKRTGRDPRALPRLVIYDPQLTLDLPRRVTASSGLNALAHAVAVILSHRSDPLAPLHAREAVRVLVDALAAAVDRPHDLGARSHALYGALLAASALASSRLDGFHHRLCHIVGGSYDLTHADVHAVLLPHTVAFERDRGGPGLPLLGDAFGITDPVRGLLDLAHRLGAPTDLASVGLPGDALPAVGARATGELELRETTARQRLAVLLDDAWSGRPPRDPDRTTPQQGERR
jgi:maleylacetate reductase